MSNKSFKDWEIVEEIGSGGQGTVYKVHKNGSVFALKKVKISKPYKRERFSNELKAIKNISHLNVIEIIDDNFDTIDSDTHGMYVMPYAQFGNLNIHIQTFKNQFEFTLDYFKKICSGLLSAHSHNPPIIHRDIKADNILIIDSFNTPVISDFGICYSDDFEIRLTSTEDQVGPKGQTSPEQEPGSNLKPTIQTDIYLLGKLLYRMLSGGNSLPRERFDKEEYNLFIKYNDPRYKRLNEELFTNMLDEEPSRRFDSIQDIIKAIDDIIKNKPFNFFSFNLHISNKLIQFEKDHNMAAFKQLLKEYRQPICDDILSLNLNNTSEILNHFGNQSSQINQYIDIMVSAIEIKSEDMVKEIIQDLQEMMEIIYFRDNIDENNIDYLYLIVTSIYQLILMFSVKKLNFDILSILLHTKCQYTDARNNQDWAVPMKINRLWNNNLLIEDDTYTNKFVLEYCKAYLIDTNRINNDKEAIHLYVKMNYILCLASSFYNERKKSSVNYQYPLFGNYDEASILSFYRMLISNPLILKGFAEKIFFIPSTPNEFFNKCVMAHKVNEKYFSSTDWASIEGNRLEKFIQKNRLS